MHNKKIGNIKNIHIMALSQLEKNYTLENWEKYIKGIFLLVLFFIEIPVSQYKVLY